VGDNTHHTQGKSICNKIKGFPKLPLSIVGCNDNVVFTNKNIISVILQFCA